MDRIRIRREALEFALEAARNTYPEEFIGMLREKDGLITHILVVPRSTYGRGFSSIDLNMLPMLSHSCGSFHSHPTPVARPSSQDRAFFAKTGEAHIIAGYPYRVSDARGYNREGKEIPVLVEE